MLSTRDLLRQPDLQWYLSSRFFNGMALTLMRATISWHVFALTSSAFHLGLIGLLQFVPTLFLSLVGGAIADAYPRRSVILVTQLAALVASTVVCFATFVHRDTVGLLYAVAIANAVAASFESPARQSLLPTLVPREMFPRAVSLHSTIQNIAWVSGPVVAGFAIADFGVASSYLIRMLLIVASIVTIARLRREVESGAERRVVSIAAIREGLQFVRRRREVLGAMAVDMFAVVFGSATALLPIYANDILQVGARGYGILSASFEGGALLMAVLLLVLPPIERAGRALLIAIVVYGLATIVFGLSRSFPLSIVAFMIAGMADQISVVSRSVIVQLSTPDELRGRVSSVNFVFIGASNQLGAAESGFVAALTSATFSVVAGGVLALVVAAVIAQQLPELRRYRI